MHVSIAVCMYDESNEFDAGMRACVYDCMYVSIRVCMRVRVR
jgi:hypothetical protein